MLSRSAGLAIRRHRAVLLLALVAFLASGAIGGGVAEQLSSGGFEDPDAESTRADEVLAETFGTGTPNIVLLVEAPGGDVDDPAVAAAGREVAESLRAETHDGQPMTEVLAYWDLPAGNPLASEAGDAALIVARFDADDNALVELSHDLIEDYEVDAGDPAGTGTSPVTVHVGGFGPLFAQVNETIEADLLRAEAIAIPITLLLLILVFGSVVAALLPLAIGMLSVVGTFVVLLVVNQFTEVSVFALNLTTAMGLGLAIDYSLFMVSRYREELAAGHDVPVAIDRTVRSAGRTVLFSAGTVAASLCALLVFDIAFLRSFAYAGLAVSALAGLYAVLVLPAMLAGLGHRIDALTVWKRSTRPTSEGFWHRMATTVMRRPVPITVGVLTLLFVLGAPAFGMELGFPDDRVLAPGHEARYVQDVIRDDFTSEEAGAVSVVATGVDAPEARADAVAELASSLAVLDGVTRVDSEVGIFCGSTGALGGVACEPGQLVVPAEASPDLTDRLRRDDATYLSVVPDVEPISAEGESLARAVRQVEVPVDLGADDVLVGGQSAELVDSKSSLFGDLPVALAIIAVITFVLLFGMFGSVLVPVKALVLNLLSLSATFGAMVWVFQEGNGAEVLDFTPTGALAATVPVLMFCVAFGLSMDYEVFLLSRIKEEHDAGRSNVESVATGLQRTGRIVTAAAVLMSVVFLAFATSSVSFIKLFGLGLTLAVLLDAFVIRGTLVPAFMRMAGEANWWAPGPMKRLHQRFGFSEHVDLDGDGRADGTESPDVDLTEPDREPVGAGTT